MGDLIWKLNMWPNLVCMHKCVYMPGRLVSCLHRQSKSECLETLYWLTVKNVILFFFNVMVKDKTVLHTSAMNVKNTFNEDLSETGLN